MKLNRILLLLLLVMPVIGFSQITKVKGVVVDAQTQEPLPFVNVFFQGTNIGTVTNMEGHYSIETKFPTDVLIAEYLGYEDGEIKVKKDDKQVINFALSTEAQVLETVEIKAKKQKYNKKNNPAIDLSLKVIENSYRNSLESEPYYSYKKQEKLRLDFNNITKKLLKSPVIRNMKFINNYIDTSEVNGKPYLPFYLKENLSNIYWKRKGKIKKEVKYASRLTDLEANVDAKTITDIMDVMYQDIDIYKGQIKLLSKQFVSPFHSSGKDFYRYYIMDTTEVNGIPAFQLAFIPAVKGNKGFTGDVYISNDGKYTVLKVDMGIVKDINLNFIRDLRIKQEFEQIGERYVKTYDQIVVDYAPTRNGVGMFGTRTVVMDDFKFEQPEDMSVFKKIDKVIDLKGAMKRSKKYWEENRITNLDEIDKGVDGLANELNNSKSFKGLMYALSALRTGYLTFDKFAIGDITSFYSFNSIDGTNLRFGGETTWNLSPKFEAKGSITRALKAKIWKYQASAKYFFTESHADFPTHYMKFSVLKNSEFPGQELDDFGVENVLFSFSRGDASRMLLSSTYKAEYFKEFEGYGYGFKLIHKNRSPWGNMKFNYTDPKTNALASVDNLNSSELVLNFKYAPNEQFIQGKTRRTPIYNQYPIFRLDIAQSFKGVLGSDYNYTKMRLDVFKQFPWTLAGQTNVHMQLGYTIGEIPYILQFIPRGNQTYSTIWKSFNMMNFMEFSADKYVSLNIEHFGEGFIFNRIPLFRRLKWREAFVLKGIYGGLKDSVNPNLNPDQIQFPINGDGKVTTYTFGNVPYMEGSVGITNIFKFLRVDMVYRMTYQDHLNVPTLFGVKGLGIRGGLKIGF